MLSRSTVFKLLISSRVRITAGRTSLSFSRFNLSLVNATWYRKLTMLDNWISWLVIDNNVPAELVKNKLFLFLVDNWKSRIVNIIIYKKVPR